MISFPNAKINLGLNIIEKRNDGYHNIESVFYPVNWCDVLEIMKSDELEFNSSGLEIPGNPENNLIIKALVLLKDKGHLAKENTKIHLHKVIPMGAGLGGGSADGAFMLKMLNEEFELQINNEILENYASELGSDCAFFIENKPVFCFGRGNEFKSIELDLSKFYIYLINPEIHISTAEAYSGVTPSSPKISILDIINQPIITWKENLKNDFEENLLLKYPPIKLVKDTLYANGAMYASMTGSGSTVYGIFENQIEGLQLFPEYKQWKGILN